MGAVRVLSQLGYLESPDSLPATVQAIFGKTAPSSLVMSNDPAHLLLGGPVPDLHGVVRPLSGVQTVDLPGGGADPRYEKRHALNLLKPMHSDAFWVMLLVLAVLGVFSFGIRIGPIKASVGS
jgi:hypothetical protein